MGGVLWLEVSTDDHASAPVWSLLGCFLPTLDNQLSLQSSGFDSWVMEQWINQTLFLRTTSTPWFLIRVPPFFDSRDCHYHHLRKLHHRNYDWDNLQNYNNQTNIWIRSPETLVTLDSNNVLPTNEFRPNKSSQSQWISYFQCNCLEEGLAEEMLGWISQTGRVRSCITLWNS